MKPTLLAITLFALAPIAGAEFDHETYPYDWDNCHYGSVAVIKEFCDSAVSQRAICDDLGIVHGQETLAWAQEFIKRSELEWEPDKVFSLYRPSEDGDKVRYGRSGPHSLNNLAANLRCSRTVVGRCCR